MRYLIDCDPGADDVMALLYAMNREELDIRGIITVSGNVPLDTVTYNACGVLKLTGRNIPVCKGSAKPLVKKSFNASDVHGESGIGSLSLPDGKTNLVEMNFIDFYMEKLFESEEKTTIIALGPMTNLALLIKVHPEAASRIEKIVFMGGAYNNGNVTPYAEFNAYVDPEAYKILFDTEIKMVMVGLDATHMSLLKLEEISSLELHSEAGKFIKDLLTWYCKNVMEVYGYEGANMHDPSAIMYVTNPEIFTSFVSTLDISTNDDITRGKILINNRSQKKNVTVLSSLDNEKFKKVFFETLSKYN
ncbi:MAG: nucleoside hydrolase [Clostridiaceae bacterium]